MQEKDLIKYVQGKANPDEKKSILEWIKKDIKNQKHYNQLKAKYVISSLDSAEKPDIEKAYKKFVSKKTKGSKIFYRTAVAAILLPLLTWQIFTHFYKDLKFNDGNDFFGTSTKNVITGYGSQRTVILPDGSAVTLNAESSLIYPKKFSDSSRQVILNGEAFFDIKRNINKPFIVNTEYLKIRVLGTSFNVKSYPTDEKIETTLVSGKVEVIQDRTNSLIVLNPSQRATFDKEKSNIEVDQVDSRRIVAWKEGKLIFDETSLKQVVLDLNRKYNVEFVIKSDSLLHYKYTGEFDNLSLEEVLELLKLSSPIYYKYKNNKVMINSE